MIKLIMVALMLPMPLSAQYGDEGKKWVLNGYLVNMQSLTMMDLPDSLDLGLPKNDPTYYNLNTYFQNRLNLFWYASDKFTLTAQMRNRLLIGDQVRTDFTGQVEHSYEHSGNWFNPSWNVAVGNSYILNLAFDRLCASYTSGAFELNVGKQRINWGKTFGFNPNDMFNTYSYFDFDYEEKPGTDAVRAIYYTGVASSLEVAANIDSAEKVSAAARWNINRFNYDFQLIGGMLKNDDLAMGFGWSGYLGGASWRGELGYYHPFENFADTSGVVMLSTGTDYSINVKWMVQAEVLFARLPEGKDISFGGFYTPAQSVKDLAVSPFQFLAGASFQATPLSVFSLAAIFYPHKDIEGIFVGPSWSYSLSDNFSAAVYWQFFNGIFPDMLTGHMEKQSVNAGFIRFKYSF